MFSSSKAGRGARLSLRSPQVRVVAGAVVAAVAVSSFAFSGTDAGAATLPNSQSVGRFVDGSLGTTPIQSIADVKDARAVNPGATSVQNPLDVNLLQKLDLPLTGALQLPQLLGITLGAANQVAVAHADGFSYGASGAVNNSGGVSVGGNNNAFPADATIDLTGKDIPGNLLSGLNSVLNVTASIGAVSALASTPVGVDAGSSTNYQIAGLDLDIDSPLLGNLLTPLTGALGGLLSQLTGALGTANLPTSCILSGSTDIPTLSLEGGAITVDITTGTITVSLDKLLTQLGLDLNTLPANTDLVKYLLDYITSPAGLAAALKSAIDGLVDPLTTTLNTCLSDLGPLAALATLLGKLTTSLDGLTTQLSDLVGKLGSSLASPLSPIADTLGKLIDIGVNVQPNGAAGTYTDKLKATPAQDTPVVAGQTVVRAIEVNLLGNAVNLALANAAAGPSNPTTAVTSPPASSSPPASNVPTGVPAGFGTKGGTPALPLILLIVGLLTAASGVTAQRMRARRTH